MLTAIDASFNENQVNGTILVPFVPIADPDAGDYATFTLTKVVATPDDGSDVTTIFSVAPSNGAIRLMRPALDFEYQRHYVLTIVAQDKACVCRGNPKRVVSPPHLFPLCPTRCRSQFTLHPIIVCRLAPCVHGANAACPQKEPPISVTTTATIRVLDVNERPVVSPVLILLDENSPAGTLVGFPILARDQDVERAGSSQTIAYSIEVAQGGASSLPFAIDSVTGQIVVSDSVLNFEAVPAYNLSVVATDNGVPVLAATAIVTVQLRCVAACFCIYAGPCMPFPCPPSRFNFPLFSTRVYRYVWCTQGFERGADDVPGHHAGGPGELCSRHHAVLLGGARPGRRRCLDVRRVLPTGGVGSVCHRQQQRHCNHHGVG